MPFQHRVVVVTGGAGALGQAVVATLLDRGARVIAPCRDINEQQALSPRAGPTLDRPLLADLTEEAAVDALYNRIDPPWASLHLAGGFDMAPLLDTPLARLQQQLDLNLLTAWTCCRGAVRAMRRGAGGGRIVMVAARPAMEPTAGMSAYAVSKAAVVALTKSLAVELRPDGILVNAVAPSIIDTAANRAAMPGADHTRWPKPSELAEAICWLASPQNALTSGTVVPVYGRA
jgi:NAD(P)-dependent dehydrogenase (short-subunit alcohol dehydrogenase family)